MIDHVGLVRVRNCSNTSIAPPSSRPKPQLLGARDRRRDPGVKQGKTVDLASELKRFRIRCHVLTQADSAGALADLRSPVVLWHQR